MARARAGVRRLPPPVRRHLLLTLGSLEEELLTWHAETGAAFVLDLSRDIPVDYALSIFLRVLDVPDRQRDAVARRTLALLEERHHADDIATRGHGEDDMIARLRRRLGGRRRDDLRARVGAGAARARRGARELYVDGARQVAAELRDLMPPAEAVQLYVDALELQPGWAETVFHDAVAGMDLPAA